MIQLWDAATIGALDAAFPEEWRMAGSGIVKA
jgi:hypothetical protein